MRPGLRERKKLQTRRHIFEAARRLFDEHGFDAVTVADVARAADVSEVTVINYFPTKEDLFYGGMQFFEEQLIEAVRIRAKGESAIDALRHALIGSIDGLASPERQDAVLKAARVMGSSPDLAAREREIVERYTRQLAALLAAETRADPLDVEPLGMAAAMMGVHRSLVVFTRARVLAGVRGPRLLKEMRAQLRRALARLEKGLSGYAVKRGKLQPPRSA